MLGALDRIAQPSSLRPFPRHLGKRVRLSQRSLDASPTFAALGSNRIELIGNIGHCG
jgi:hypothetical protein